MDNSKNIIIRMPNWLGDLVMATPVLSAIRHKWKEARITAMCQSNVSGLLQQNPNVDEIYSYKKPSGWIHRHHPIDIIEKLRFGQYDLGILLTNSFSSAWWFWRGRVQNRIGFKTNLRSLLLNQAVPYPANKESQHLVLTYQELLKPLGIKPSSEKPKLYLSLEEIEAAKNRLQSLNIDLSQPVIGINPGAAYGSAKCWLPERFQEVTKRLVKELNASVLYFGDSSLVPLVDQICSPLKDAKHFNLAGKTSLRELLALIHCCSAFLTNDSGPMHIASALNVPLIALFGSTSEIKTGPYNGGTIIHKHVSCSPCYKRVCPIDFRCMTQISADEVYQSIYKLIKNNGLHKS